MTHGLWIAVRCENYCKKSNEKKGNEKKIAMTTAGEKPAFNLSSAIFLCSLYRQLLLVFQGNAIATSIFTPSIILN